MQKSPCFHVRPASTTAGDLSQVRQNASRGILGVIYTPAQLITISTQVRINHKTYNFFFRNSYKLIILCVLYSGEADVCGVSLSFIHCTWHPVSSEIYDPCEVRDHS